MRFAAIIMAFAAFIGVAGLAGSEPEKPGGAPAKDGNAHAFACTDYSQGKVFIISEKGEIEWEYQAPGCNDLWVLPNGNLLFNAGRRVKEVTRAKKVVFDYQSKSEIYACQRLANGNTFVGECNSGRLLEISPELKIVHEVRLLPEGKNAGSGFMRNARRLPNGNTLVAHYQDQVVREYDPQGKVVMTIPAAGSPHSVARLPSGNTLISCGDGTGGPRIFEVDPTGKTVWEVTAKDQPGFKFLAGFQRLPSGNTVVANWQGHGKFEGMPHLFELTPDKKVQWQYGPNPKIRTISSVQMLDVKGDVTKGEILH